MILIYWIQSMYRRILIHMMFTLEQQGVRNIVEKMNIRFETA